MNQARPRVMGIVNVTPDSFSDGGKYLGAADGIEHARRLIAQGADILDIGGESTRPGAAPVSEFDEILRVVPIIEAIRQASDIPISIDTMKPGVARAAMKAGATIWNDVAALRLSPEAPEVAAELGCEVVLMHMLGEPGTMQDDPRYGDVVAEVEAFLLARAFTAMAAGVAKEKIWLDPGIGFGKTLHHNLALMHALAILHSLGTPVLLGASFNDRGDRLRVSYQIDTPPLARRVAVARGGWLRLSCYPPEPAWLLALDQADGSRLPPPSWTRSRRSMTPRKP